MTTYIFMLAPDKPGRIVEPDKIEVAMVRKAFAALLEELRDWKPS